MLIEPYPGGQKPDVIGFFMYYEKAKKKYDHKGSFTGPKYRFWFEVAHINSKKNRISYL